MKKVLYSNFEHYYISKKNVLNVSVQKKLLYNIIKSPKNLTNKLYCVNLKMIKIITGLEKMHSLENTMKKVIFKSLT